MKTDAQCFATSTARSDEAPAYAAKLAMMGKLGIGNATASLLRANAAELPADLLNKVRIQRLSDKEAKDRHSLVPRLRRNRMVNLGNEALVLESLREAFTSMLEAYTFTDAEQSAAPDSFIDQQFTILLAGEKAILRHHLALADAAKQRLLDDDDNE
jgi:homoserine dehydrogenase